MQASPEERSPAILEQRQELLEQNQALLERHQTEITALNDQMMKAQEEERTRIASELHDGVLQQITSVSLLLGSLKYEAPLDAPIRKSEHRYISVTVRRRTEEKRQS